MDEQGRQDKRNFTGVTTHAGTKAAKAKGSRERVGRGDVGKGAQTRSRVSGFGFGVLGFGLLREEVGNIGLDRFSQGATTAIRMGEQTADTTSGTSVTTSVTSVSVIGTTGTSAITRSTGATKEFADVLVEDPALDLRVLGEARVGRIDYSRRGAQVTAEISGRREEL